MNQLTSKDQTKRRSAWTVGRQQFRTLMARTFRLRSLRRYIDMAIATMIAVAIVPIFEGSLTRIFSRIIFAACSLGAISMLTLSLGSVVGLFFLISRLNGFPAFNLRVFFRYPPTWVFGNLGFIVYSSLRFTLQGDVPKIQYFSEVAIGLLVLFVCLVVSQVRSWKMNQTGLSQFTLETAENGGSELDRWILNEGPIEKPEQDRFDVSPIASRLAALLIESFSSTCLVGQYGAGKTSLAKLLQSQLRVMEKQKKTVVAFVDIWDIRIDNAESHMLDRAIDQLAAHVDCESIVQLPSHYQAALSGTGSAWSNVIASVLSGSSNLDQIVVRLDRILGSSGLRLLIVVEDLDRVHLTSEELRGILGLLDRLKKLTHVAYLLMIGPHNIGKEEFIRICDYHESLPTLEVTVISTEILRFREFCFKLYPDDIDPVERDSRDKRFGASLVQSLGASYSVQFGLAIYDLCQLLNTPRLLKHVLRRTLTTWKRSHGEIDLDELNNFQLI